MGRLLKWIASTVVALLVLTALTVALLRFVHPYTSAFMLRERLEAQRTHDTHYQTRYEWVDYRRISPHVALAVIASEDQLFPFHHGFDVKSIKEAEKTNEEGGRLRGASTISQQLAKNLFLWPGKSYLRKGLEAWFTVLLETLWPKERILETYLNVVQFGPGVYGVEAASRLYFHTSAGNLTPADAALLAAVLPNPDRLHVDRPSRYVLERREWILGQMRMLGGDEFLSALAHASHRPPEPPPRPHHSSH